MVIGAVLLSASGCGFHLRSYGFSGTLDSFALTGRTNLEVATAVRQQLRQAGIDEASPSEAAGILERLGPKSTFHREQWTVPLWNLWPLIITFLLVVGAEWVLRKSTGLI